MLFTLIMNEIFVWALNLIRKVAMRWVSTLACSKVTCVHLLSLVVWPCQCRSLWLIMCLLISNQEYTCEQNHLASPLCWINRFVQKHLADKYHVSMVIQLHLENLCWAFDDIVSCLRVLEVCFEAAQTWSSEVFGDVLHPQVPRVGMKSP